MPSVTCSLLLTAKRSFRLSYWHSFGLYFVLWYLVVCDMPSHCLALFILLFRDNFQLMNSIETKFHWNVYCWLNHLRWFWWFIGWGRLGYGCTGSGSGQISGEICGSGMALLSRDLALDPVESRVLIYLWHLLCSTGCLHELKFILHVYLLYVIYELWPWNNLRIIVMQ